jgi:transposase-like protein/ribosomal protein L37AE/L43A
MEDYPRNIMEFEKRFNTEQKCRQYLFKMKWPDGFKCPSCAHNQVWGVRRNVYQCRSCGYETSVTSGTIFHDTHKPLQMWLRAMWYVTNQKHGISALGLQRALGQGSYHTAWEWLHRLRHAMVRPDRDRLSGTIEVDETYIGGEHAGKRGRGSDGKALVLIAAQIEGKRIGRIRLQRIPNASGESLESAIEATVLPESRIITDGWEGYNRLKSLGYAHHRAKVESHVGDTLLPKCHLVASLLKRWLLGTFQGRVLHLDYYLDEFTFRFNRRTSASRGKLFYRLVQQALTVKPVVAKELIL